MNATEDVATKVEAVDPSQEVVERVASREGVNHTELVPLFYAIDPDALDKLVESSQGEESALQITFAYHGYGVTVRADGMVHLERNENVGG